MCLQGEFATKDAPLKRNIAADNIDFRCFNMIITIRSNLTRLETQNTRDFISTLQV